jgi:hypothetical protein
MGKKRGAPSKQWKVFEKNVSDKLGVWFCGDADAFKRSPCSGGFATRHKEVADRLSGDVYPAAKDVDEDWPFVVECKYRKVWSLENLLTGAAAGNEMSDIMMWWAQCKRDAENGGRHPLLIWYRPGTKYTFAALSEDTLNSLAGHIGRIRVRSLVFEDLDGSRARIFCLRWLLGFLDAESVKLWWRSQRK